VQLIQRRAFQKVLELGLIEPTKMMMVMMIIKTVLTIVI